VRLKDVTVSGPAYSGPDRNEAVAFVPMESLRCGSIDQKEIGFSEAKGKYTFFADGDVLFAKVTPCFENGNVAVARGLKGGIGFGSSEIFVLRPGKKVSSQYLFYLVQGSPFRDGACATMCGVGGLKRISPDFTRTFEFDLPDDNEQRRIVAYLDEKTAAIDRRVELLEKKKEAVARLKKSIINRAVTRGLDPNAKLKDSGVDWIGQVPKGWAVKRVKDCFRIISGSGFRPDLQGSQEGEIPVCKASDIAQAGHRLVSAASRLSRKDAENNGFSIIPSGSILHAKVGEAMKKNNRTLTLVDCCVDNNCQGLVPLGICSEFSYYLLSLIDMSFFDNGGPIPCVSNQTLRGLLFALPPISEQRAIADYLDAECAKIDAAVANLDKQIDAYRRLKRSLLDEVVTGKRKVG